MKPYVPISLSPRCSAAHRQRGVVLIFSLIALAIMLLGAVALVSSFNTTLVASGNIGFKRDLQNQSERAFNAVFAQFAGGGALATSLQRANNIGAQNYSAVALATNTQGIPLALLDNSVFSSAPLSFTKPDITVLDRKITIRYVVDRLCGPTSAGRSAQSVDDGVCISASGGRIAGGDSSRTSGDDASRGDASRAVSNGTGGSTTGLGEAGVRVPVAYRITARVSGPRNVQSFFQTTFSEPL
jgi:type IV pilus assembly protein PilX